MTLTTYLAYAKSGREFEVEDALRELDIPTWCGRVIDSKRTGKRRKAEYTETPKLPNYLFIDLTPHTFYDAIAVKHLYPFLYALSEWDKRSLAAFRRQVEDDYAVMDRQRQRGEKIIAEYAPGERVWHKVFDDMVMRFRRVVETEPIQYEVEAELMGRAVRMKADPLDLSRIS